MSDSFSQQINTLAQSETDLAKNSILLLEKYHDLEKRYTALFKLNQLAHDCVELNDFFDQLHQVIKKLMIAKNFYVVMYDQGQSTLDFVYHIDEKDHYYNGVYPCETFKGSLTSYVIKTAKPLLASPEVIETLAIQKEIALIGNDSVDWLGIPLISEGFVIGVMAVQSYEEAVRYTDQDLALLNFASHHVVSTMMRLQDHERLKRAVNARTRELMQQIREREKSELLQESLYRISELTSDHSLAITNFYAQVHNIIGQLINASNFYIARYNDEDQMLSFVYHLDQHPQSTDADFEPRKCVQHITELVIRNAKTMLLSKDEMRALYENGEVSSYQAENSSWLGVPLINANEVLGVMVLQSYDKETIFTQQDADLLNFVSHHISTAIRRRLKSDDVRETQNLLEKQVKLRTAALEEEIKQREGIEKQLIHNASHDDLTGLANRSVFIDLLNHAIARTQRKSDLHFAILFLDLDRFKMVNDILGHHAGDLLLKIVAKELTRIVRGKDTVARMGGDEFVILIEDIEGQQEAYEVAARITDLLATPFVIEKQEIFIGTSIGLLFSDPRYDNAETMLRDADTAMYHAKGQGKGRYETFDSSMHNKVQNALMLEADIRDAIKGKEFIPYFQPIIELHTGLISGFEALARWPSKTRGFVYPDEFIPLAEETNLVMEIDFQIVEKSCQQLKLWQIELGRDDLYVSCNLFGNHFFSTTLVDDISAILTSTGVSPQQLRVELTERALLENSEVVLLNMRGLKELGIKILLDDFGTGYSSLSYLHRFPLDIIKIDRSFISNVQGHDNENHQAIIKTIIDLATNLNMATVGEGIESLEDATLLKKMNCQFGQGYYFAKPMNAEQTTQSLLAHFN
jgi:diguanylate cyclase (GGDEF)-like protein